MEIDKDNNLVWIDLEMTGLEDEHEIIEIASLVTNNELEILAEGPQIVIKKTEKQLENINEWSLDQHTKSGLLEKVKQSDISILEAEQITLNFLKDWVNEKTSPLCGNSISTDRRFIRREMQTLEDFLHYRMIDVSTVKELVARWYPNINIPIKKNSHLAMDDIKESVEELKWYRNNTFIIPSN
ncbi:MAG: oligoribonuclease [SAR202 cluster bacterium]|nr:oligoribonuclease [SAR202 cluster bacterium]|tara:strand:+ start:44 stop:595 length:552 start_codon:yes stop_codon:yes gene_type:complete